MLNEVHLEGIVTRGGWAFGGASFIRLAVYRDDDRPRKVRPGSQDRQDEADFVTLRCEGPLALAAQALKVGARVRASGTLVTRDYEIPLSRFAAEAQAPEKGRANTSALAELKQVAGQFGRELVFGHTLTEILVLRLLSLAEPERTDAPCAVEATRPRAGVTSTGHAAMPSPARPAPAARRNGGPARPAADASAENGVPAVEEVTPAPQQPAAFSAEAGVTIAGAAPSADGWTTTTGAG